MKPAIEIDDLHKTYRLYGNPYNRLKERLPWNRGRRLHREVHALKGITATITAGQCVGLIGGNGAGKSTLLKILSGTTFPTRGSYVIRGDVASLLELGAGFHPNFTGRENIYMNAALKGLSRREMKQKLQEIVDFSELTDFIDSPIRTYSSGMVARLGFSVAIATDPDVLIIDEILAVGDMHFRRKCVDRIMSFKQRGKTMFFCSHSLYDVRQICDTAIWLKNGEAQMIGDSVLVTNEYATYENQLIEAQEVDPWQGQAEQARPKPVLAEDLARIVSARIVDPATGKPRHVFAAGDDVAIRVHVKNSEVPERLNVVVGFTRTDGTLCYAPATHLDGVEVAFQEGVVTLHLPEIKLLSGEFLVPVFLLDEHGVHRFHEQPCAENLVIQNRDKELGLFRPDRRWTVEVLDPAPAGGASR